VTTSRVTRSTTVERPGPPARTEAGDLLTDLVVTTFRLNGALLDAAQDLAAEGGLTAAWWQVLGAVVDEPRSVAAIGRHMGMSRQGVLRVADLLVANHLAEYRPNPDHKRAKLLACTQAGHAAIARIALVQRPWADRIGAELGVRQLRQALATTRGLIATLDADRPDP
jgi:DNA-binding MarR family transcriptional regulator